MLLTIPTQPGIPWIKNTRINYQHPPVALIKACIERGEGRLTNNGTLVINTGEFTGRSPKDRFIVRDEITASTVDWNDFNIPVDEKYFFLIREKIQNWLAAKEEVWLRDCFACADNQFRLGVRVITETPSFNLFTHNMFIRPGPGELDNFLPDWTIIAAPGLSLEPNACGTRQHNAVVLSFKHKTILLAGTGYTGELKKGIFSVLNFLLPHYSAVLPMHCSANVGKDGDCALFFGLSGTGKTTLSSDPNRKLVGDDEHGWSDDGIFNFEGGCYAKTIDLSPEKEPAIYHAIRPCAMLENTPFFPGSNQPDFSSRAITENTRVSYPLHYIQNAITQSVARSPSNIFFLTCDAYGILPAISKLSPEQAMHYFMAGYTARIAGTESGIKEPKAVFSACFGAPFLPLHPSIYAKMLGEKIKQSGAKVWMINTGWNGGAYETGERIALFYTRAIISAVLEGTLDKVQYKQHLFGILIPVSCPGVPDTVLNPRQGWRDKNAYDRAAKNLQALFAANAEKYRI
jgi:phosphoenolpyruvate carboxykinase (ATP)